MEILFFKKTLNVQWSCVQKYIDCIFVYLSLSVNIVNICLHCISFFYTLIFPILDWNDLCKSFLEWIFLNIYITLTLTNFKLIIYFIILRIIKLTCSI